jgi:hypothetical protein
MARKRVSRKGKAVRRNVVDWYMHKKHYSKKRAEYVAGAVAFNEHKKKSKKRKSHKK